MKMSNYEEKDFLPNCHHPLHTIMVMCYAAHFMQKMVTKYDFGQTITQEKYEQLKEQMEDLACKIVNSFNMNGPNEAIQVRCALQADYQSEFVKIKREMSPYEEYLDRKFHRSKEIMTIAYRAKAMV
uniref:Phage protein n=2 Tax=Caenorhabditis tropicalis TaxID=1561998 RepID=A0A1I7UWU1_9PELO